LVDVRANDQTIVSQAALTPGGEVAFKAPAKAGWVYASLMLPDGLEARRAACEPIWGSQTSYCRDHLLMAAITSAIYLAQPTSIPGKIRHKASSQTSTVHWGQARNEGMAPTAATRLAATGVPVLAAALILLARLRRRRMEES
ncbi:MAG: hypothetical protein WDA71_12975, partial [Actinomycetota bacterium]